MNEHADEQARFDLFERINTGSKIAKEAEVRRGALVGPFLDLVVALAEEPLFKKLAPVPEKDRKLREREELVTRFFAYGDGLDDYNDRVGDFLFAYAKKTNNRFQKTPGAVALYRARFMDTMTFVSRVFPFGFRRARKGLATPRARFEAIAIGSYLALKERPALAEDLPQVADWLDGKDFRDVTTSDSANAIKKLKNRIGFVRDQLLGETTDGHAK